MFHHLVSNYSTFGTSRVQVSSKMESCVQRSPKRRKITDFFQKQLSNTEQQQQETETERPQQQVMPMFLRRDQPTLVPRRKGPVGRPRRQSQSESVTDTEPESSQEPEETKNRKPRVFTSHLACVKSLRLSSLLVKILNVLLVDDMECHEPRFMGGRTLIRNQPQRKKYPQSLKGSIQRRVLVDTSPIHKRSMMSCCHGYYIREICRFVSEDKTSSSRQRHCFLKDAPASRPPMVGWTSSCVVTPCLSGKVCKFF